MRPHLLENSLANFLRGCGALLLFSGLVAGLAVLLSHCLAHPLVDSVADLSDQTAVVSAIIIVSFFLKAFIICSR